MKQIRISDDLDVVVSEPQDNTESEFNYLVKQGKNSYSKVLRPLDESSCFIWVNGIYVDYIDKDVFDDDDFEKHVIDVIKECKTIEEVFDCIGVDYYKASKNIYDFIDELASSDAYSEEDIEALRNMPEQELIKFILEHTEFFYTKFGAYHVLSV